MRITALSDTHCRHYSIADTSFPGGDLLIHAGDISSSGSPQEIEGFLKWFYRISKRYDRSLFIAGNHDKFYDTSEPTTADVDTHSRILQYHGPETNCHYIEPCTSITINDIKIHGIPYTPESMNKWYFRYPRGSELAHEIFDTIPQDVDILITHAPPHGILDVPYPNGIQNVGCEVLRQKVFEKLPKISIFGHVHGGYGYKEVDGIHFINVAALDEKYQHSHEILTFDWDKSNNTIQFL